MDAEVSHSFYFKYRAQGDEISTCPAHSRVRKSITILSVMHFHFHSSCIQKQEIRMIESIGC